MIGRNDSCHCGSGKKYKRCCGSTGTDLVEMIVNEELDRILKGFFDDYPIGLDEDEMMVTMQKWASRLSESWDKEDVEEASSEFYLFIQNPAGWHAYIQKQVEQTERESVVAVLKEWDEPFMLLAEIIKVDTNAIHVREIFGEKEYKVTRNEGMPADVGTLLFGVVLHDSRKGEKAIAPVSSMLFLAKWSKQTKKSLVELREVALEKTGEQFILKHTLDIYELFIKRSMASMNELVEEVLAKEQLSALRALDATLRDLEQTADSQEIMHKLGVAYFLNENPKVTDEGDFLAAAIKTGVGIGVVQGTGLDDEAIMKRFAASTEGVAAFSEELESLYGDMMDSGDEPIAERIYDIGTDPRTTEKALWETSMTTGGVVQPERKPNVAGGRAQLLAYEAYLAETEEQRRELAESAIKMDGNNSDALLLQAEIEKDYEKVIALYEKAIKHASRTFEPGENPWQNIPNRPFMRAAFAYGVYLFEQAEYDEAASLFVDLLKMNKVDNQGARYEAASSLIQAGRFDEAAEILVRYEKGSGHDATYLYLDWKLEDGGTGGESKSSEEMLQTAVKANSHVMHLQTFRTKPIPYPRLQKIVPGSVEEARYIWLLLSGVVKK